MRADADTGPKGGRADSGLSDPLKPRAESPAVGCDLVGVGCVSGWVFRSSLPAGVLLLASNERSREPFL